MKKQYENDNTNLKLLRAQEESSRAPKKSGKGNVDKQVSGRQKKVNVIFPAEIDGGEAGGDGYKKKGGESSSTRWGEEWLSTEDVGQHPGKLRSPGERELSGYDNNTTTVGQPDDRKHLRVIDSKNPDVGRKLE